MSSKLIKVEDRNHYCSLL